MNQNAVLHYKWMHKGLFVYDRKWQLPLLCMEWKGRCRSTYSLDLQISPFVLGIISTDPFINLQRMDPTTSSYWYLKQRAVFPLWQKAFSASITGTIERFLFSGIKALGVLFELLWFSLSWIQVEWLQCYQDEWDDVGHPYDTQSFLRNST